MISDLVVPLVSLSYQDEILDPKGTLMKWTPDWSVTSQYTWKVDNVGCHKFMGSKIRNIYSFVFKFVVQQIQAIHKKIVSYKKQWFHIMIFFQHIISKLRLLIIMCQKHLLCLQSFNASIHYRVIVLFKISKLYTTLIQLL